VSGEAIGRQRTNQTKLIKITLDANSVGEPFKRSY